MKRPCNVQSLFVIDLVDAFVLLVGIFAKLGEDTHGALRMQEGNLKTIGPLAGSSIDEADAFLIALSQRIGYAILNAECHMVYALVAFVQPLLNSAFGASGFKKFQFHLTHLKESGLYLLILDDLGLIALQAKHVLEIRQDFVNALHGDAQMFNL